METWAQKIQSRKFLAMLFAVMANIGLFGQGQIDANTFLAGIVAAIGLWTASEAAVDAARARG